MLTEAENLTQLLQEARQGKQSSADRLIEAVYGELRKVARRYMGSERPGHTLQPTAIVNEVFMRLFKPTVNGLHLQTVAIDWQSRAHFLGVAAKQMRQVLIDHARSKRVLKRNAVRVSLDDAGPLPGEDRMEHDVEDLDRLLMALATKDPDAAKVVELKFFGGLTDKEVAEVMGTNFAKIRRDWDFARSWLRHRLTKAAGES